MTLENVKLIEPVLEMKSEFLAMAQEFENSGENDIIGIGSISIDDFDNSINKVKDHSHGIDLPEKDGFRLQHTG